MTKLAATLCTALALLTGLPGGAAAQGALQPLAADDPAARLLSGLLEPMLTGDGTAAAAYLRRHADAAAEPDSLDAQLRRILAAVHAQDDPRLDGFFLAASGDVIAALAAGEGLRLFVGAVRPPEQLRIAELIASPAWFTPPVPVPAEPSIPGLLRLSGTPEVVAFVGVTVIPMDGERVLPNHTVVVRDGRIAEMGPSASVRAPAGAHVVDGTGRYLMPGLAEMHAHIPTPQQGPGALERTLFLFVAHGVTTIRGMLGHPAHLELRARAAAGEHLSPRVYTSGPSINGQSAPTPEDGVRLVEAQHAAGYDFLKLHPGLERPVFDAVVAAARRVGIPFAGHVSAAVGLDHTLAARQATIDHLDGYLEALAGLGGGFTPQESGFFGFNLVERAEEARTAELAEATRAAGVWNVPTMSLMEHQYSPATPEMLAARPEMRWMPAPTVTNWTTNTAARRADPAATPERMARYLELRRRVLLELHRAGAGLLLGSDAPQMWNVPGASIQHELRMMVEAGLTPYEALRTGTYAPARFFGTDAWGTVAPGRAADLILLEANPLDDVAHLDRRAGVMVRGAWLPEAEIRARLAAIEAALHPAPAPTGDGG